MRPGHNAGTRWDGVINMQMDQNKIKAQNLRKVFSLISQKAPVTRGELAKESKLSLMTISNMVEKLLELGLVTTENRKYDNRIGRKADLVSVDRNNKQVMILDLTQMDFSYTVLNIQLEMTVPIQGYCYDRTKEYRDNLVCFLKEIVAFMQKQNLEEHVIGVGICIPGPYLIEQDICVNKRIKDLSGIKIKALLRQYLDKEILFIDEDVKLAAVANTYFIADIKKKTVMYIYLGEGVGGTIIAGGEPLRGINSVAGDVGQLFYDSRSNYEEHLSLRAAFLKITGEESCNCDSAEMISRILQAQASNPMAYKKALSDLYHTAARLLHNIVWLIDPHEIVIECAYLQQIDPNFPDMLEKEFAALVEGVLPGRPQIHYNNSDMKDCYRGVAIEIINHWLDKQQ